MSNEAVEDPVVLGDGAGLERWAAQARAASGAWHAGEPGPALALARAMADDLPAPGEGSTLALWEALATVAAVDLGVARVVEPHLDAHHILRELAEPVDVPADAVWGVYAAEGPGVAVTATPTDDGWRLDGRKPWCSLADLVSHALVTAHVDGGRRLFALDLSHASSADEPWVARGLASIRSTSIDLAGAPAVPVGGTGWYLERPGFWWGGMGVAAIWFGGTVGVARALLAAAGRREPDQIAQAHVGALDHRLAAARALLVDAAARVDAGEAAGDAGYRLALQVRRTVAEAAEETLRRVGHGLGPGPLSRDEAHARRVADLEVYVRQDHAERDDAALGRLVLAQRSGLGRA